MLIKLKANHKTEVNKIQPRQKLQENSIKIQKNYNNSHIFVKILNLQISLYNLSMTNKLQKLLTEFNNLCLNETGKDSTIQAYLKTKTIQLEKSSDQSQQHPIDWKSQLIEAYSKLRKNDVLNRKIVTLCEQLVSQFQRLKKTKNLQVEVLSNQISILKSSLEQEKSENQKIKKDLQKSLSQQKQKTKQTFQRLNYKQQQITQLLQKIANYEEQIEQIKSTEYQNMLQSIKEEQIMNNETQNLYRQNALLKFQLKQENILKNQLSKHLKNLDDQIEDWKLKYEKLRQFTKKTSRVARRQSSKEERKSKEIKAQQEQTINLIEYKQDFSFKDSIENDNNTTVVHNNLQSFLDFQSGSELFCNQPEAQQSPVRFLMQRDFLNLTDRDRSTQSRNITRHLLRSKKRYIMDKQNISDNTLQLNDFQHFQPSHKRHNDQKLNKTKELNSNCSIDQYVSSPRLIGTQQRNSFLNKHRRIKSSFCGKSIQEFQEYENNHFFVNSQKYQQSIYEEDNETNNIVDESSIMQCGVNQIVINEELISSKKEKSLHSANLLNTVTAKMISSIQVGCPSVAVSNAIDIYYAFFSLTAQCVKLNSKNFNKVISIYFNLQQQYKNVVQKTIPINKWYNYIQDQIQTSLKYTS